MADATSGKSKVTVTEEHEEVYAIIASKFQWDDLSEDTCMDIGCGNGRSSVYLLTNYPQIKRVIAIDSMGSKIVEAQIENPHPKIEYHIADIEKKDTLERWEGQISKVISTYCFQQLVTAEVGFHHVYQLLAPGGEAVIHFSLQSAFFDWFQDVVENSKWAAFVSESSKRIPESHTKKLNSSYYQELLKNIGFTVISCQELKKTYTYPSDELCKKANLASCPVAAYIPAELRAEFEEDLFQIYLKHNRRNDEGFPQVIIVDLVVLLKKEI